VKSTALRSKSSPDFATPGDGFLPSPASLPHICVNSRIHENVNGTSGVTRGKETEETGDPNIVSRRTVLLKPLKLLAHIHHDRQTHRGTTGTEDILWNTDLRGGIIAAVQDAVIPRVSSPMGLRRFRELGCRPEEPYFNAGVLVVDLQAWRSQEVGQRAIEYLGRYSRSINLADQDALNAVLHDRWTQLEDRWNVLGGLAGRRHLEPKGIPYARMAAAARDPAIIHFAGHLKPWLYDRLGSRWAGDYRQALLEVYPDHRFDRSLQAVSIAFYDRRLRALLYPLEHLAWRATRYLP